MTHEGIWKNAEYFEAWKRGSQVEFEVMPDGGCWMHFDIGDQTEVYVMPKEQFDAFKAWIKNMDEA